MSEDPIPYTVTTRATAAKLETDEGQCRTALREMRHWFSDDKVDNDLLLGMIEDQINKLLAAPRSNGAVIDQLEEEVGKLRGQLLDYQAAEAGRRMKQHEPQTAKRGAGPFESLVNAKLGARAARIDSWLRGKIPL